MAEIKQEVLDEVVKTEANEEKSQDVKQEIKTEDVKTEPNEEKTSSDGPNNEKTGGDVSDVKPNTDLDDKIIRQVEVRVNSIASIGFLSTFKLLFFISSTTLGTITSQGTSFWVSKFFLMMVGSLFQPCSSLPAFHN